MANRRPVGGPRVALEQHLSQATASRRLPKGWDYIVLIQSSDGFSTVFDVADEPKSDILNNVYGRSFQARLQKTALLLGTTLYVEIIGISADGLRALPNFRVGHEAPSVLVMQATYDEGDLARLREAANA